MSYREKTNVEVANNSSETTQKIEEYANILIRDGIDSENAHFLAYLMYQKNLANDYRGEIEEKHPANQGNRKTWGMKTYSGAYFSAFGEIFRKIPKSRRENANWLICAILSLVETQVNIAGQHPELVSKYVENEVEEMFNKNR